jgi:hypothetical protein
MTTTKYSLVRREAYGKVSFPEKVKQCMYFDNDFRKRKILRAKSCGVIGNRNATSKK